MAFEGMDAKTRLNQFCQRYCARPVKKTDVMYTTTKFGTNQFQAIVKLSCVEGQEYAGELSLNPKEAEKSAAQQALQAFAAVEASLMANGPATRKRNPANGGAAQSLFMPGGTLVPGAPGGVTAAAEAAQCARAQIEGENPAITDKVKLNAACMKIVKRALQKGETLYETRQVAMGKGPSGYQATVQLVCLPAEWGAKLFAGQICANKQGAEQSAAAVALDAIMADPELAEVLSKEHAGAAKSGGGRGKGKGAGKGYGGMGGWRWLPSGPDLPRERLTEVVVDGEVMEWKGTFGWVKPLEAIDNPEAERREGKVYVHRQDLLGGLEELVEGSRVRFHVYCDASGLGAEEVVAA